jgi:hypothetical protein
MTDLRTQIRTAFRDEEDHRLPADEAAAMRRLVVASVRPLTDGRSAASWFQPLAVAATLVAMIAAGVAIGHRVDDRASIGAVRADDRPPGQEPDGARQLHFSTPGGTRIIWIFNSNLDLKTTP